jgi:DNA polymerase/3'-5' exonuclease PolX
VSWETNRDLARRLEEAAALPERQEASGFRAPAYHRAAEVIAAYAEDLRELTDRNGEDALQESPGVGRGIAAVPRGTLPAGRWSQLDRLRGTLDREALFATVPGVGARLGRPRHAPLAVDTLEALQAAVNVGGRDGSRQSLPGSRPVSAGCERCRSRTLSVRC